VQLPGRSPSKLQSSASVLSAYCPGSNFHCFHAHQHLIQLRGGVCWTASWDLLFLSIQFQWTGRLFLLRLRSKRCSALVLKIQALKKTIWKCKHIQNDICKTQKEIWWFQSNKLECNCFY
jgi:hypothetical protein